MKPVGSNVMSGGPWLGSPALKGLVEAEPIVPATDDAVNSSVAPPVARAMLAQPQRRAPGSMMAGASPGELMDPASTPRGRIVAAIVNRAQYQGGFDGRSPASGGLDPGAVSRNRFPPAPVAYSSGQGAQMAQASGAPSIPQLYQIMSDPRASDQVRGYAEFLLKSQISREEEAQALAAKQADPAYQMGLEKDRLELDALRNPKPSYQYFESGGDRYRFNANDPSAKPELFFDGPGPVADAPSGYRATPTGLEPIPGGPADKPAPRPMTADERQQWGIPVEDKRAYVMQGGKPEPIGGAGQTINIDNGGGYKVPAGFMPADPNNPDAGVKPIPGGPGEQVPAELAARVGLANSFLGRIGGENGIRARIAAGDATGPWDRLRAGFDDSSDQANLYKDMQSGADALQRLLTGAGMPESEARSYASRYLPSYTDTAASAEAKLDRLKGELEATRDAAMRGRGDVNIGTMPGTPPAQRATRPPPGAIERLRNNPSLAPQFDEKYGPGSAAAVLGGG